MKIVDIKMKLRYLPQEDIFQVVGWTADGVQMNNWFRKMPKDEAVWFIMTYYPGFVEGEAPEDEDPTNICTRCGRIFEEEDGYTVLGEDVVSGAYCDGCEPLKA